MSYVGLYDTYPPTFKDGVSDGPTLMHHREQYYINSTSSGSILYVWRNRSVRKEGGLFEVLIRSRKMWMKNPWWNAINMYRCVLFLWEKISFGWLRDIFTLFSRSPPLRGSSMGGHSVFELASIILSPLFSGWWRMTCLKRRGPFSSLLLLLTVYIRSNGHHPGRLYTPFCIFLHRILLFPRRLIESTSRI